jgi:hypothetical protein
MEGRKMKFLFVALGFAALGLSLSACATAMSQAAIGPTDPADSNLESGRLVCDVNSLATQKDQVIKQRDQLQSTTAEEKTSTDLDKMTEFDASIDAEYRNVVASCRAYIQCMEMNSYDETSCQSAETRWRDAEKSFSDLSIGLKALSPRPQPPGGRGRPPLGKPQRGFPSTVFDG